MLIFAKHEQAKTTNYHIALFARCLQSASGRYKRRFAYGAAR